MFRFCVCRCFLSCAEQWHGFTGSRLLTAFFAGYLMTDGPKTLETVSLELFPTARTADALPDAAYRSVVRCEPEVIRVTSAMSAIAVELEVLNASEIAWPPLRGERPIVLRPHLLDRRKNMLNLDFPSGRALLPRLIEPGDRFHATLEIDSGPIPMGRSYLEFDLVLEGSHWFADKGGTTCRVAIDKLVEH